MLKLLLCLRYLSKRKIVILSVIAVMISAALLITVASLFNGFIMAVENVATDSMGDVVILPQMKIERADELSARLESLDGVEAAAPVIMSQALMQYGRGEVAMVTLLGIDMSRQRRVSKVADHLLNNSSNAAEAFNNSYDPANPPAIVGIGVLEKPDPVTDDYDFEKLDSWLGAKFALTTGTVSVTRQNAERKLDRKRIYCNVTDFLYSGVHQFDSDYVYLPIDYLSGILYPKAAEGTLTADSVQIKLAGGIDEAAVMDSIWKSWSDFAANTLGWPDYMIYSSNNKPTVTTPAQLQQRLLDEYRKQRGVLMLIFGIISFGVILLIFCIFYMIVMTRRKDVAIIKACGGSSFSVMQIFLGFGSMVGILGAGLGVVAGYYIISNINQVENAIRVAFGLKIWKSSTYLFDRIPSQVDWPWAFGIAIAAVAAAVAGSLIPAIIAARIKPVRILRYE